MDSHLENKSSSVLVDSQNLPKLPDLVRLLLGQAPAILWTVDKNLVITTSCGSALPLVGFDSDQLVGRSLYDLFGTHDPQRDSSIDHHLRALSGESLEYENVRFERILQCTLKPLRDDQNNIFGAVGVAVDVTDNRKMAAELRHKTEELRTIIDSCPSIIFYKDCDNNILRANKAAAKSLSLPIKEVEGRSTYDLYPKDDADKYLQDDREVAGARTPKLNIIESYQSQETGRRWIRTDKVPYRDQAGEIIGVIAFATDITQQREAEERLASLAQKERDARIEAERLSHLKDEFLITLSHELRSPLAPIIGWAEMLVSSYGLEGEVLEALKVIERNAKTELQLIEDLLDTSRIISGKMTLNSEILPLSNVVRAAAEVVNMAAIAKDIQINLNLEPIDSSIRGDSVRLQQVIWNLLTNAIKFTPSGGRIDVRLHQSGLYAVLEIADTGIGIKPDFLTHIFERFRQADSSTTRRYGGLGLGLSLVKNLVEAHGGHVNADSKGLGFGSTFTVWLPSHVSSSTVFPVFDAARVVEAKAESARIRSSRLLGKTVLIVDDNEDERKMILSILRGEAAEVVEAASVREALTAIERRVPDIVLSDIAMPGEDGYSFVRKLRTLPPELGGVIPVVALTAHAGPEEREKTVLAGFSVHLAKPVEPSRLVDVIADLLHRNS